MFLGNSLITMLSAKASGLDAGSARCVNHGAESIVGINIVVLSETAVSAVLTKILLARKRAVAPCGVFRGNGVCVTMSPCTCSPLGGWLLQLP